MFLEHLNQETTDVISQGKVLYDEDNFFCRQNAYDKTDRRTQASHNALHLCVPQDVFCDGKAVHIYDTENGWTLHLWKGIEVFSEGYVYQFEASPYV